jgi:hypothetical protein
MGRQETCEIPHAPTGATCRARNAGRPSVPGLTSFLRARQERFGDTRTQEGRVGPATETIREQVRASGKS